MGRLVVFVLCVVFNRYVESYYSSLNYTGDAAGRQLEEFRQRHPYPIGVATTSSGEPIEIRNTLVINSDQSSNQNFIDLITHLNRERVPERVVHAKGVGAYGYFEVTHDVSKYTSADVFNGIGKKTPLVARFSLARSFQGSADAGNELRGLAFKFYTNEGNLDLLCLQTPIYVYRDGTVFPQFVRSRRRNPRTHLLDNSATWNFISLRPILLHTTLWTMSDYGSPRNYRTMDVFPIHTYEVTNKHGDRHYVKFNFRSEQGLDNLTDSQVRATNADDPDSFIRDLYNAIAEKRYPTWRLDMDVMTEKDIKHADFDPFDVTRLWKNGTYYTVTVGRVVFNQRVDNHFKDVEQSAYNPANLVPGIPGPVDSLFQARRLAYRDTQNYRLGVNHAKINVNLPKYAKVYNRDGIAPVNENMKDTPNYYPNSFSGPIPYVDETRPKKKLVVIENLAVDLQQPADFFNHVVESNAHRQRIINNIATNLVPVLPNVTLKVLKLLYLTDEALGSGVERRLRELKAVSRKQTREERITRNAQCFESNIRDVLRRIYKYHD